MKLTQLPNPRLRTVAVALVGVIATGSIAAYAQGIAVAKKIEIELKGADRAAREAKIWDTYGGWCAIKDWHPAIAACVESKEGDVEFRTLTLKDGGTIKEKLLERQGRLYRYEIVESPLPVQNYQAQFALTPDSDDPEEYHLAWSAVFDAKDKPDDEARDVIKGIFTDGLEAIEAKLEAAEK